MGAGEARKRGSLLCKGKARMQGEARTCKRICCGMWKATVCGALIIGKQGGLNWDPGLLLACKCRSGWVARAVRPRGLRSAERCPPRPHSRGRWHPAQGTQSWTAEFI